MSFEKMRLLQKEYGIGLATAKRYLELADYEVELARQIVEYYCYAVNKGYTIGKVIRDYWLQKENN